MPRNGRVITSLREDIVDGAAVNCEKVRGEHEHRLGATTEQRYWRTCAPYGPFLRLRSGQGPGKEKKEKKKKLGPHWSSAQSPSEVAPKSRCARGRSPEQWPPAVSVKKIVMFCFDAANLCRGSAGRIKIEE